MNKLKTSLISIFIVIELILCYFIFFTNSIHINIYCFLSIAIAAFMPLLFLKKVNTNNLINLGLISTIIADIFLVLIIPQNKTLGMIFFSITQLIYFIFINLNSKTKRKKIIQIAFTFTFIFIFEIAMILVLKQKADFLSFISIFYISVLLSNILFAYSDKKNIFFAIGLTLFICCDLFIGLQEMFLTYLPLSESSMFYKILYNNYNIAWIFYIPSQIVISLFAIKLATTPINNQTKREV